MPIGSAKKFNMVADHWASGLYRSAGLRNNLDSGVIHSVLKSSARAEVFRFTSLLAAGKTLAAECVGH